MDISIVVPLYNEEESLPDLIGWIKRVMEKEGFSFEVILIDDGSNDSSWNVIEKLSKEYLFIKALRFRRNYGKSAALHIGFQESVGDVVITMDADLQDSPEEIPDLYRMVTQEGYHLVSGWKKKRYDPLFSKKIPSKLFNSTVRYMSGIKLHDMNCGLKAYRSEVVKSIEIFGEMHRYIPVLAKQAGFNRIGEKVVVHQERKYGVTKFGWERFINGFLDLFTVIFVSRFGKKPMHLFGSLGTIMFLAGGVITLWLIISKLHAQFNHLNFRPVTDKPLFYIALVMAVIGMQLFVAGFLGELISRSSAERNNYLVEKKLSKIEDSL